MSVLSFHDPRPDRRSRIVPLLALAPLLFGACAPLEIPPPPRPAETIPIVAVAPPPVAGQGQVAIDALDGRAQVSEVKGVISFGASSVFESQPAAVQGGGVDMAPVCETPCVANLPYGDHQIHIALTNADGSVRSLTDTIVVGARPSDYRAALGLRRQHPGELLGGVVLSALGGASVLTGGMLYALGDSMRSTSTTNAASVRGAGLDIALGGAVATLVGILLIHAARPEEQPGAGVQWIPEGPFYATP